jgi:periplasmic protein TonB
MPFEPAALWDSFLNAVRLYYRQRARNLQQSSVVWAVACGALRGLIVHGTCVVLRRTRNNPIVDSAVDTRPSTASPSAKSPKAAGENSPANPRRNAVACEVHVTATGARPSEKGGQRELFTEETTTALVFENGGVLRLAAAVVPGQLLFLTHKETKSEVVAQVTRKRDFRPMICYVEVEFSEPAPGFWGVEFSETPALGPAPSQQKEPDGSAQDAEAIFSSEPIAPAPAPSVQEIAMLNEEVEALREQLKLLQAQKATGNLPAPAPTPDLSRTTAPEPPRAAVDVPAQAPVLAEAHGEQLTKWPTGAAEPAFSEEDLLPKPALDFKSAKPPAKLAPKPEQKVTAASHPAAMRKDLLFAAFVLLVAGAAWYQNLLPGLPLLKNLVSGNASSIDAHAAVPALQKTTNAPINSAKSPQTSEAAPTPSSADLHDAPQSGASGTAKPSTSAAPEKAVEAISSPDAAADAAPVQETPEVADSAAKRSAPPALSKAALVSAVPPSDGVAIVPPKLIKSVRAIASPNALSDFATSNSNNVTFEALVDTSGHVTSMKVLSGSPALQSTAMAALKQYRYEPATRRGKPVPAHVTVTIKFLFEP